MALKSILVYFDERRDMASTMAVARELASRHDAHLTAAYVAPYMNPAMFVDGYMPVTTMDAMNESAEQQAAAARAAFESHMQGHEGRHEWRELDGMPDSEIARASYLADLTIMGQTRENNERTGSHGIENAIIVGAGCPVLMVPYIGTHDALGKSVSIAWNETRESSRALHDALPLLTAADKVDVVSVRPAGSDTDPVAGVIDYLEKHGITASNTRLVEDKVPVGTMLLNHVCDNGSDLLVMGAYGHSRVREMMLGGATRDILRHMTVPILFAH